MVVFPTSRDYEITPASTRMTLCVVPSDSFSYPSEYFAKDTLHCSIRLLLFRARVRRQMAGARLSWGGSRTRVAVKLLSQEHPLSELYHPLFFSFFLILFYFHSVLRLARLKKGASPPIFLSSFSCLYELYGGMEMNKWYQSWVSWWSGDDACG